MKISLIIPCYNEEESLNPFYTELNNVSRDMADYEFEMIFVDDGSKDSSAKIVNDCLLPNIRLVSYGENRGKGCAVRHGMP